MARTAITPTTLKHPKFDFAGAQPVADSLDFTFTAGDVSNGNKVAFTKDQIILLIQNSHGSNAYTTTVTSALLDGRLLNITAYSLAAGDFAGVYLPSEGWRQSDGQLYIDSENAAVKYKAFFLP